MSDSEKHVVYNADDELLARLGYKAELKRNFSVIEVFGIAFSIMSLMPSIASVISFSLSGGPVTMTWGWLVPSCFILSVGVAMAEMGSALPTSGGLYWWAFKFSPERLKRPLCFLTGYTNTLGLIGGICSINYGFALMVMSIPSIFDNTFAAKDWQVYLVFLACMISHALVGSVATSIMSRLQGFCIYTNLIVLLITMIALPIGRGHANLNSAKYVFTHNENSTTWPTGWNFFLSWMAAIWTIGAFDSCVHMSEEASNAARAVPLGIIMSISMCGLLGFAVLAVIAATITDIPSVLATPFGQPMAQIYYDALGPKWAGGMMAMLAFVQWFMGLSIVVAASRQSWAFSRDGALPFSSLLRRVNHKLGVPLYAMWFVCMCSALVTLLILAGSQASSALFSLAACSNGLAWLIPIACRHIWFDKDAFTPGPFYLGHFWSRINGLVATVYLTFTVFILTLFPSGGPNPGVEGMNYTVVFNGGIWLLAMSYYFLSARKWFTGPKSTLDEEIFGDEVVVIEPVSVKK